MTHLFRLGPALPYQAQTECGMTVSTMEIDEAEPTCMVCSIIAGMREAADLEEDLVCPL